MIPQPVLLIAVQAAVSALVLGFTDDNSIIRPASLLVIVLCTWQCVSTALFHLERRPWANTASAYSLQLLLHYIDVALIGQWSFAGAAITKRRYPAPPKIKRSRISTIQTWRRRLLFGLSTTFTCRFIGTKDQIHRIPPFSRVQPHHVPSRRRFLIETGLLVTICYLFIDLLQFSKGAVNPTKYVTLQHVPVFRRLAELTAEEIVVRALVTALVVCSVVFTQMGIYSMLAFLAVLLRFSDPWEWPPFFGYIFDCFTIRRIWSHFWHQSNTHKFKTLSDFVVHRLLFLRRGTLHARYAKNLVVFAISGLMHIPIDLASGISLSESGAMACFCGQIIGLVAEDFVIRLYFRLVARLGRRLPGLVETYLGYAWAIAFIAWSSPAYLYPKICRAGAGGRANDSILPVSVVRLGLDLLQGVW